MGGPADLRSRPRDEVPLRSGGARLLLVRGAGRDGHPDRARGVTAMRRADSRRGSARRTGRDRPSRLRAHGTERGHCMIKWTLVLSSLYLAAIGLGLMLVPLQFGVGAVPPDASPQLIALLRLLGGPFLGIAVLNWLSRNAEPSPTRRAVLLANLVGFGGVAANDVWGVASGAARELAKVFLVVHGLFALAFLAAL